MVLRRGDHLLARRAAHHPRRAALVLSLGDPDSADFAGGIRLAMRQTEGLIGSIFHLLGLVLAVLDHTTLCRRTETLEVHRPRSRPRREGEAVYLLVDSTGLKLCGSGEWLLEKYGTKTRRSWRSCTSAWMPTPARLSPRR